MSVSRQSHICEGPIPKFNEILEKTFYCRHSYLNRQASPDKTAPLKSSNVVISDILSYQQLIHSTNSTRHSAKYGNIMVNEMIPALTKLTVMIRGTDINHIMECN